MSRFAIAAVAALACVGPFSPCSVRLRADVGKSAFAADVAAAATAQDAAAILVQREQTRPRSEEHFGELTVISRDGKQRRKQWRSYRTGLSGDTDRFIRFLWPPDVRGVGFLARHRRGRSPDEWLYLPSMKRERRVGTRDRDAAFVGTSFSYEDLEMLEFDESRYEAAMLPTQMVGGVAAYVIELRPIRRSGYSRQVLVLQQSDLRLLSVDYFVSASSAPVKRLSLSDYSTIGGYLVAARIEMADFRKATRTIVVLRDVAVDRPQPPGRYTIQNLLREHDDDRPAAAPAARPSLLPSGRQPASQPDRSAARLAATFSGYVEAKGFGFFGDPSLQSAASSVWGSAVLQNRLAIGAARFTGSLRFEQSTSSRVGPFGFDPADRRALRSPVSIRALSLTVPVRPTVDVEAGRLDVAWGDTDGYSPADAFVPRDLSDSATDERLALWAARLRGEHRGIRFEYLAVPVTTPWRLPPLGRQSPFLVVPATVVENPWSVPHRGFQAARASVHRNAWDASGWVRRGLRPAPILVPTIEVVDGVRHAQIDRRFADETAAGGSLSRDYAGWIVRGEIGVFRSDDTDLGNAAIWTFGASRTVGNGTFTGTIAANAIAPPVEPLLLLDRAILPGIILAIREYETWGNWRAGWLGTLHTVGGVLTADATKNLTDVLAVTVGSELPHGAALSPASAFAGGKRVRAAIRWSW